VLPQLSVGLSYRFQPVFLTFRWITCELMVRHSASC
jgi:hypothetical protein